MISQNLRLTAPKSLHLKACLSANPIPHARNKRTLESSLKIFNQQFAVQEIMHYGDSKNRGKLEGRQYNPGGNNLNYKRIDFYDGCHALAMHILIYLNHFTS